MNKKESHTIRNGIIATVIGGILLSFWPPFLNIIKKIFLWLWRVLVAIFTYLQTEHSVYGWVIVILSIMSVVLALHLISMIRKHEPGFQELYKEDSLFGVDWFWDYINKKIIRLWCLCPKCKNELVYSEFIPNQFNYMHKGKSPYTEFICERCGVTKSKIDGDKTHALSTVEREIRRKIRTEEWKDNNRR